MLASTDSRCRNHIFNQSFQAKRDFFCVESTNFVPLLLHSISYR